jgi:hypothetical protein
MKRRTRIILWIYLVGVVIVELLLVWNAYDNGGFQRHHTPSDLVLVAIIHVTMGLLWPIALAVGILQYFGVLPHRITF